MTLTYLRQYAELIDSILVSILTFSESRISEIHSQLPNLDGWPCKIQGQTNFSQMCIIFKVNHHSYIICFRFAEFLDLDYVKINTEIQVCSMYSARDNEGNYESMFDLDFQGQLIEVRRHMSVILRFQTSDMSKSTPTLCLYSLSRIQPMMNKGSQ